MISDERARVAVVRRDNRCAQGHRCRAGRHDEPKRASLRRSRVPSWRSRGAVLPAAPNEPAECRLDVDATLAESW